MAKRQWLEAIIELARWFRDTDHSVAALHAAPNDVNWESSVVGEDRRDVPFIPFAAAPGDEEE